MVLQGSVFFPTPDGKGELHKLVGIAGPPLASGNLDKDVTAKVVETVSLAVSNPLHIPQRFQVHIKLNEVRPLCTNLERRPHSLRAYMLRERDVARGHPSATSCMAKVL